MLGSGVPHPSGSLCLHQKSSYPPHNSPRGSPGRLRRPPALWEERILYGSFPTYQWFLFSSVVPPSSLRTASSQAETVSMRTSRWRQLGAGR